MNLHMLLFPFTKIYGERQNVLYTLLRIRQNKTKPEFIKLVRKKNFKKVNNKVRMKH